MLLYVVTTQQPHSSAINLSLSMYPIHTTYILLYLIIEMAVFRTDRSYLCRSADGFVEFCQSHLFRGKRNRKSNSEPLQQEAAFEREIHPTTANILPTDSSPISLRPFRRLSELSDHSTPSNRDHPIPEAMNFRL